MDIPSDWACFRSPGTALLCGATGQGKSHLMTQIIAHRDQLFDRPVQSVIWHYTEEGSVPTELAEKHGVIFKEGPPCLEDFPPGEGLKILVLDDMMPEISKNLVEFFLKGSHHRNIHVFLLVQNLYNKKIREISLNSHVVILFKHRRDLSQIRHFCMQIDPASWRSIFAAYKDATDRPGHQYFLCDFHVKTPNFLRFRTDILPNQKQIVYVIKK
jgi:hypothetical protein